jgi:hypothetical protein
VCGPAATLEGGGGPAPAAELSRWTDDEHHCYASPPVIGRTVLVLADAAEASVGSS